MLRGTVNAHRISCVTAEDATSHERQLKTFAKEVRHPICSSPLAPRLIKTRRAPIPPPQGQPGLPKCSEHLANHPLASVASSKHAEVMLICRFNVIPEVSVPNSNSKKVYTQLYMEKLSDGHFDVVSDLLSALRSSSAAGFTA